MISDQRLAKQILDLMNTALEAIEQLYHYLEEGEMGAFHQIYMDLDALYHSIGRVSDTLQAEESGLNLCQAIPSVLYSLKYIVECQDKNRSLALHKIEFELLPLAEDMRMRFYFWGCVYPDPKKLSYYYEYEINDYFGNVYTQDAERIGHYKYELSIVIRAYNKLNYTKMCLESLFDNLPKNISYELILLNHGSTDETMAYFESLHPDKQLNILVNGGGAEAFARIAEGRYILHISNDILIGANAIENLYNCMQRDSSVAWAVPSTPNISNMQNIDLKYKDTKEFKMAAQRNNVCNPFRREQRVRLCNPIEICRSSYFEQMKTQGYIHSKNPFAFPDDKVAALCRRNHYKMMLVKDAYCYHFGSVTIKEEWAKQRETQVYLKGRAEFYKVFGIDPWGKGFCYDYRLFHEPIFGKKESTHILGVNCGLGSNPLKIKEELRSGNHNLKVSLSNFTSEACFIEDLKGISDHIYFAENLNCIHNTLPDIIFDYIISEADLDSEADYQNIILQLMNLLSAEGYIILTLHDSDKINWVQNHFSNIIQITEKTNDSFLENIHWLYWKKN